MKQTVLYARSSLKRLIDREKSLESQIKRLEKLARKKKLKIDCRFIEYYSRKNPCGLALKQLLQEVKENQIKNILVTDMSRFSNQFFDNLAVDKFLKNRQVKIITCESEDTKSSLAYKKLLEAMLTAIGEYSHQSRHSKKNLV